MCSLNQVKYLISGVVIFYCCDETINDQNIEDYGIVINEINYHSSDNFDPDDWVEIYNNSIDTIDISLWQLKDDNDNHIFTVPPETIISPEQYVVFCKDSLKFIGLFPNVEFYHGDLGFGLSGNSDQIRLFDSKGSLADIVEYDDDPPWPSEADGGGPTLELRHPSLDNKDWKSWSPSMDNGTPGALNSVYNIDL